MTLPSSSNQLPAQVSELLTSKPAQIAFAASTVLLIGTVAFALVWSIIQNQPINPIAGNVLSFLLGAAASLLGGHTGAALYSSGARTQASTLASANASVNASGNAPTAAASMP